MRILLATNHLWRYTGAECNLMDLARALAVRGHQLACYAVFVAPAMKAPFEEAGARVLVADAEVDAFAPDAIFCQHHPVASLLRDRLPEVPMVLAHLGVEPILEQAPLVPCGVDLHLAISEEARAALVAQGVPEEKIRVFRNVVEARRRPSASERSGALLFSYKLSRETCSVLSCVVGEMGLSLDTDSLAKSGTLRPDHVAEKLGHARLVIASGRSALEAATAGAAVVVLGPAGLDGALTAQTLQTLAEANFSGRRHGARVTPESVRQAVTEALASNVQETLAEVRRQFDPHQRAEQLESILAAASPPVMSALDVARNQRLARLLHEQRWMAVYQAELTRTSWWGKVKARWSWLP